MRSSITGVSVGALLSAMMVSPLGARSNTAAQLPFRKRSANSGADIKSSRIEKRLAR